MLQKEPLTEQAKSFKGLNIAGIENTVLATIVNKKVLDVKELKVNGKRTAPLVSFKKALSDRTKKNFILECKKSSPTLGNFCKDFDLDKITDCYNTRAAAISVLCEKHFFNGSSEYLSYVKSKTALPVLYKDFVICKEQIDDAHVSGADAVLLMLSLLENDTYLSLYSYAKSLNLDVLTEVDNQEQARFAKEHNIDIVGINNRNLRTLDIDINNAKELSKIFDSNTIVVSESGINEHSDLFYLKEISCFLIGSSLTKSDDIVFKANSMLYGTNKICGITTKEALNAAIDVHASIAGFIFFEKSVRNISVEKAVEFEDSARGKIRFAGVFVNESLDTVELIAQKAGLDYVQLHGCEDLEYITNLKNRLPNTKIIKALNIESSDDFSKIDYYNDSCEYIILDSKAPGSGSSFDWNSIPDCVNKNKILLSGGIGIDNVEKALSFGFAGLDLNSKLEETKGIKSVTKILNTFRVINNF